MKMMSSSVTWLFVIGIILYFIYVCYQDLLKLRKINEELKKYTKKIKEFEDINNIEKSQEERYKYLNNLVKEEIESADEYIFIGEKIKKYFNTLIKKNWRGVEASLVFNEEDIVFKQINVTNLSQRPSTFVGLGLLGTFSGIALGLYKLGNIENVSEQISLIDKMLPSMSMAFSTSIAGIVCSIFYSCLEKNWLGEISLNILVTSSALDELFFEERDINNSLEKIEMALLDLNKGINKDLSSAVATTMGESTRVLFNGFNKEVNNFSTQLGNIFNGFFSNEIVYEFKNAQNSLKEINQSFVETQKAVTNLLRSIPRYTEKFEKLTETSLNIYENSEKTANNYKVFLEEIEEIGKIIKDLNSFKQDILEMIKFSNECITDNSQKMMTTSEGIHQKYIGISQDIKSIMQTSKEEITSLLKDSNIILNENTANIRAMNKEMKDTILSTNKEINDSQKMLKGNMDQIEKVILNDLGKMQTFTRENSDLIKDNYKRMNENQEKLASNTKKALSDYDNTISKLNREIIDIISNIKDMEREQ